MKLLILGGTRFLSRHVASLALAAGHRVTLLHRGRSGAVLFSEAEHLIADRDGALDVLDNGHWDAVIDTSAYVPRQVRAMAAALRKRAGHYQLVSTVSVYAAPMKDFDEDAPLTVLSDPTTETVDGSTYGGLKALCEQALHETWPAAGACVVRPGLIVGPHDPTGRFTCGPAMPPDAPLTMRGMLETARATLNPSATLTWDDEGFLLDQRVRPWVELPVWLDRLSSGMATARLGRAIAAGLACRPLAETFRDTAAWAATEEPPGPAEGPPRPAVGLGPEREGALLAAWHSRR